MNPMTTAPRDGRFVAVSMGTQMLTFAYFESGHWIAPQMIGRPELGSDVILPFGWVDIPTPSRN